MSETIYRALRLASLQTLVDDKTNLALAEWYIPRSLLSDQEEDHDKLEDIRFLHRYGHNVLLDTNIKVSCNIIGTRRLPVSDLGESPLLSAAALSRSLDWHRLALEWLPYDSLATELTPGFVVELVEEVLCRERQEDYLSSLDWISDELGLQLSHKLEEHRQVGWAKEMLAVYPQECALFVINHVCLAKRG